MTGISCRFAYLKTLFLALFLCYGTEVMGTHSAGSDITYRCLGGNLYEVTVSFYRDCGGVSEPASVTINCKSLNAGANINLTAMKLPGYGNEITLPCNGNATNCNGGSGTGIREWKYRATVTLPSAQADWVFSYNICCRNCSITTIQNPCAATSVLYVEARLNNLNGICNSSPSFSNIPVAYVCLGQNYNYNHGVNDEDGDSLVYSLVTPKTSTSTNITFISPYNAQNPIASSTPFSLHPSNGDINFTPSMIQIGVLAILVREYRNGELIGSVMRDMQVYIFPCSNALPVLSGINGGNQYDISACIDQPVCFDINSNDPDNTQAISLATNNGIPGATYTLSGGLNPTLHFCWTPTAADAGSTQTFTVQARDNSCPFNGAQVYSYRIHVQDTLQLSSTNTQCNEPDGSVSVFPIPGNASYLWNTGATTSTINNLIAGTYTVTVTTNGGCTLTDSIRITNQGMLLLNAESNTTCYSECAGRITIQPSGGTPPYTFNWSNGATTSMLRDLCIGQYNLSVSDANGCSTDSVFPILAATPLQALLNISHQLCSQPGNASITISGGKPPYSIHWSNGDTLATTTALLAGNYSVSIHDSAGCDTTLHFNVLQQGQTLNLQSQQINATCNGKANGQAYITALNGTAPYTYTWNNQTSTQGIDSLAAGDYIAMVTDAVGCTGSDTISITEPSAIQVTVSLNQPSCSKLNGSVSLIVNGGTSPYTFNWNNGMSGSSISGLTAANYTVLITDNHQCTLQETFTLSSAAVLDLNTVTSAPTCPGSNNGTAQLSVINGIAPFQYLWSDGSTNASRSDLSHGNYLVTVTDSMLCTINKPINIPEAPEMRYSSKTTNAVCLLNVTGSVQIQPEGNWILLTCVWEDSVSAFNRSDLPAGTYHYTLTDNNNCTVLDSVVIADDSELELQVNNTSICVGEMASMHLLPATNDSTLQWYFNDAPLNGVTGNEFQSPAAGSYYVTANNTCGNYKSNVLTIEVNTMTSLQISSEQLICPGDQAILEVNGGVSYKWLPAEGLNDSTGNKVTVNPLQTTVYSVIATDANGCTGIASVKVTVICDNTEIPAGFSPNNDGTNDYFVIEKIEEFPGNVIYIYNRWGNLVYKKKEYDNTWNGDGNVSGQLNGTALTDGTYYYILDLNNNQPPLSGYVILRR